jgi:F0F1-type ATP synthase gamma subunit
LFRGEYQEVYLLYAHFVNTLIQKLLRKILPISFETMLKTAEPQTGKVEASMNPFLLNPTVKQY